jgi:hypothetical protein
MAAQKSTDETGTHVERVIELWRRKLKPRNSRNWPVIYRRRKQGACRTYGGSGVFAAAQESRVQLRPAGGEESGASA